MKASELKSGDQFKLIGGRKIRTVHKAIELAKHDDIPPVGRKVLIIVDNCRQISFLKDEEVILVPSANSFFPIWVATSLKPVGLYHLAILNQPTVSICGRVKDVTREYKAHDPESLPQRNRCIVCFKNYLHE